MSRTGASRAPDGRFFETRPPASLGELATLTGAELRRGDPDRRIAAAATLPHCGPDGVTFLTDGKRAPELAGTWAGACFVADALACHAPEGCAILVTPQPQAAFAAAAARLHQPRLQPCEGPSVHPRARLGEGVQIASGVSIGPEAVIGRRTRIGPGAAIGPGVAIGCDCEIGPGVVVGFALLGDRVRLLAGAVVGEAGFGATLGPKGLIDIPQLGRVILQDGVSVGANSCIDRGAFDDTVVGEDTKIDNLVQIAHNVSIGRNCVFAAHCGVSGSVVIGDGCMFGGRVGIADHVVIGSGVKLAASSGVMRDIPAGETWGGTPARPMRQWMRETAWTSAMAARRGAKGAER